MSSCVLVVGTTGTGKTSTVNLYTGSNLQVGDSAQAVTGNTVAVEDEIHPGAPVGLIIQVGNLLKLNGDSLLSKYEGWSDTEQ